MVVRQHRRKGRAPAVCALAVAGVMAVGAGCSGTAGGEADGRAVTGASGATGAPAAVVRQAADALARAGGAEAHTSMETAAGGTRLTIRGQGVYDFGRQLGRFKVVLPKEASGSSGGHRPITELLAPGALYMKHRGAGVPEDKWVRIDTTALADGNLVTGGVTDPTAAAELLRGAGEVRYVGRTELAGVAVSHYRGTADLGRAARDASPASRGTMAAAAKGFEAGSGTVPFDAYLDDEGLLRKVRHRFSYAAEGPAVSVVSTMLLYGFGARVSVELPPDEDIYTGSVQQGADGPEVRKGEARSGEEP
ncbi:hypothetical protein OG909_17425 [Streptomyces sp. NBC_01754]|uniref:hypothetical protein n=1 Tax=Streptomyces sp. NBC_01754 TaxID=2975930 RepID=UPI002DDC8EFD|nr:hypothetical protein [Streptomyces sp. NBC_01754]WSC93905.1 hypothetical protein OG909_17425 [Streptomyces sp. NBC_01754]